MTRRKHFLFFLTFFLCTVWFSGNVFANVLNFSVTLNSESYTSRPIEVEPSDRSVTVEIINGSGDIDLYVRKGTPAQGSSSSELKINSDFASESPSWQERITINSSTNPPLSAGTWYITVVNLNSYPVSVDVRVSSQTSTGSTGSGSNGSGGTTISQPPAKGINPNFRPQVGLWYNKEKPGHGVDIEQSGSNLAAVWYTYNPDSTPTWYLAIGPYSGQSTWTATLNKYHWNGTSAVANPVGTITLEFKNRTKATFSWNLNGQSGSEPLERFTMADHVPQTNLTGLWYNSSEPGYGYSIDTQGDNVAIVAYFYDSQGEPRWALNSSQGSVFSQAIVPALTFLGPCPNCSGTNFTSAPAGTITRSFSDSTHGTIGVNITLPAPMNSSWSRPVSPVVLLSSPVNNSELDLEIAVDEVMGVFSDTTDMLDGLAGDLGSLDLSNINSSTCPRVSYGDLSNLNLSGPMHIPLRVDFGSGCTDNDGNSWSGGISAPINVTLGSSSMHLDTNVSVNNLTRNGLFLGSGTTSIVLDLSQSGSSDLLSGTGQINLNMTSVDHQPLTGQIGLQFNNITLEPLVDTESDTSGFSFSSLLQVVGRGGSIQVNINNLVRGSYRVSGTISVRSQSQGVGRVDLNLQTSDGPVVGSFTVRQGSSPSDIFVSTVSPATIYNYQVSVNNLELNPSVCENSPVGGSMDVTKGGNRGRFTFDSSCLGYTYTGL